MLSRFLDVGPGSSPESLASADATLLSTIMLMVVAAVAAVMTRVVVVVTTAVVAETITRWLPFASSSSAQTAGLEAASRASNWSDCEERDRAGVGGRAARTELEGGRGGTGQLTRGQSLRHPPPPPLWCARQRAARSSGSGRRRSAREDYTARDPPPGGGVPQPSELASPAAHDLSYRLVPAAGAPGPVPAAHRVGNYSVSSGLFAKVPQSSQSSNADRAKIDFELRMPFG